MDSAADWSIGRYSFYDDVVSSLKIGMQRQRYWALDRLHQKF